MSISPNCISFSNNVAFKSNVLKEMPKAAKLGAGIVAGALATTAAANVSKPVTEPNITIEEAKSQIKLLQGDLKYQMQHPPKTRDAIDWGYYNVYMNNLQSKIDELRKICPLDKTNLEEVLAAKPQEIFSPIKADNIKGKGISFLQVLPDDIEALKQNTYKVVPMLTHARTVEDLINIGKRDGINIELVKDNNGEYFLGVKNIWNNGYFRIDRDSAVIKYGLQPLDYTGVDEKWIAENSVQVADKDGNMQTMVMDSAVIANADGLRILEKSYVHEGGAKITQRDMIDWNGYFAHKDPAAIVNAVAWEKPREIKTLEGPINVDATMGDVEGFAYNDFKQLVKQIQKNKIRANSEDPNSVEFCKLVMENKLDEAKALLIEATKNSEKGDK